MKNWIKQYKAALMAAIFVVFAGVPFLIHCLFKLDSRYDFFVAEWSAGEFLQYYGALLAFCSSVVLSLLALWQNEVIREESNKHTQLLEHMEIKSKMPLFDVRYKSQELHGRCHNAKAEITNISENVALALRIRDVYLSNNETKKTWDIPEYTREILTPGNVWEIDLKNPFLTKDDSICFYMTCRDLYENDLRFKVLGDYNSQKNTIEFQILEAADH